MVEISLATGTTTVSANHCTSQTPYGHWSVERMGHLPDGSSQSNEQLPLDLSLTQSTPSEDRDRNTNTHTHLLESKGVER